MSLWDEFLAPGILCMISLPNMRSVGDCLRGREGGLGQFWEPAGIPFHASQ